MKASKFSDAQKAFILKPGDDGLPAEAVTLFSNDGTRLQRSSRSFQEYSRNDVAGHIRIVPGKAVFCCFWAVLNRFNLRVS